MAWCIFLCERYELAKTSERDGIILSCSRGGGVVPGEKRVEVYGLSEMVD